MISKCKYYNNHQSACTLMIDDLVPAAISPFKNEKTGTKFDGGFLMDSDYSLYKYFENNLLKKYPEIKGTFFLPLTAHNHLNKNSGYNIKTGDYNDEFIHFLKRLSPHFDSAFHGTSHGKFIDLENFEFKNNWHQEFEYITLNDIENINNEIQNFQNNSGIQFTGGKYPGYKKNEYSEEILEKLGLKWWASSAQMIGRKHVKNMHSYFGLEEKILDFPTNVPGNLFNTTLSSTPSKRKWLKFITGTFKNYKNEQYLQYLHENGLIISIQEHFQNQRTDGQRQNQNVYDDIVSLDKIFGILHGADIWYATCSEIAHYLESFDYTDIIKKDEITFEIVYRGRWSKPLLSVTSKNSEIINLTDKKIYKGVYKNGLWIYNNVIPGLYKLV